jgi:DNA-binding transcriptional MocR family regulator
MGITRYQNIAEEIAASIRNGTLAPGMQLPTVRALMRQHGVALATAGRVYKVLERTGLIVGEQGRGTFVRDISLPRGDGLVQHARATATVDLAFSYPALPGQVDMLREGLRALAQSGDLDALLQSAPQGGTRHQRETAARHLRNRGIRVPGSQVLVTNGTQHGLSITVSAVLEPGDVLAVDSLTYPGIKALAQAHRVELAALPQKNGSTDLDSLNALCKRRRVRAFYCMPTLHNPLGSVMPERERAYLAALAERHDFLIIEDGAYAFLAEPAPKPLQALAPERTIYVTGLSKSFASGLRVGFIVAPPSIVPALEHAIRLSIWSTPSITVALGCRWIESGAIDALEEKKRKDARQRQAMARRILRHGASIAHPSSYFLWLQLPDGLRADDVARQLNEEGVLVTTADSFSTVSHAPQALRLALGSVPLQVLKEALTKVNEAASY